MEASKCCQISVYHYLTSLHRGSVDLSNYDREKTHLIELELEDQAGYLTFYLTVTALAFYGSESDNATHVCNRQEIEAEFSIRETWKKPDRIGWLKVSCFLFFFIFIFCFLYFYISFFISDSFLFFLLLLLEFFSLNATH